MAFDAIYESCREGVRRAVVDAGPQPDEMVRLQMALDAAEGEIDRLNRLVDTLSRALARYQDEEMEVGED